MPAYKRVTCTHTKLGTHPLNRTMLGWRGTFPSSSTSRTIKSEETAPGLRASLWFGKEARSRGEGVSRTHQLGTQVEVAVV